MKMIHFTSSIDDMHLNNSYYWRLNLKSHVPVLLCMTGHLCTLFSQVHLKGNVLIGMSTKSTFISRKPDGWVLSDALKGVLNF